MDRVEAIRAFLAVAEEGSFTGAGRRLGRSVKLVSNHVAWLEERLGAQLFNRTTRSVALTDTGTAYLERARPLLDQFDELDDLVQDRQTALSGPIRITAPTGFGSTWLVEALAPFLAKHPGVAVELVLSDTRVALVEEGFDLGVRIGILRDSSLRMRKLADMPQITCAAPAYLDARGVPEVPSDLVDHECLLDRAREDAAAWRYPTPDGEQTVRVTGRFRANAPAALARMAVAGLGIARCPAYSVAAHLEAGRLVELFADHRAGEFGLFALYPPNRHLTARMRALIDHLAVAFAGGWAVPVPTDLTRDSA